MKLIITVGSVLGIGTALATLSPVKPRRVEVDARSQVCSVDSLGKALAVDTTRLKKRTAELPEGEATEGGEVTVYTEDGHPRVLVILYGGEMGRSVVSYFLASSTDYVIQYEQVRYEMPLRINANAKLLSRLTSTRYVCGASELDVPDHDERTRMDAQLGATLRRLGLSS